MASLIRLPKLKFCGITQMADVSAAIECGADAIGLNFYPASSRYVSPAHAQDLSRSAAGKALVVGVFVNREPAEVADIAAECSLDCIQLHGEEPPSWIDQANLFASLKSLPIIKAVSWRGCQEDQENLLEWTSSPPQRLLGLLVDSFDPIQRGGTGRTARWDLLFPRPIEFGNIKIMLAGGLKPENVAQAILTAKPDGIDMASGIESAPGIKDSEKMRAVAKIALPLLHS
jgi:phosphoribosylanthranilate isomerase